MKFKCSVKLILLALAMASLVSCASAGAAAKDNPVPSAAEKKQVSLPPHADQAYLHFMKGYLDEKSGDIQSAINEYAAAITYDKDSAYLQVAMAKALMKQGRLGESLLYAEDAVKKDDGYQPAFMFLGALYASSSRMDDAAAAYCRAIELDPGKEDAYIYLSSLYTSQKKYDKAVEVLKKLEGLKSDSSMATFYLGRVYADMKEYDKAIEAFKKVSEQRPELEIARTSMAII